MKKYETNKRRIKSEKPGTSTAYAREQQEQEHDLAFYIHDRVELMHQVFSVLKPKDLKAMAPESVGRLTIDDLQELCTEELLGISSKRLCAILDGGKPPSDTESSSQSPTPEQMETISLDSISSDEEILSQSSKKKKHKHRRRGSKSKHKRRKSNSPEQSRASRAGLTVLELLELQARARAIRAQLQQDQASTRLEATTVQSSQDSSESEVEIKEEPAEVVILSSDEEKPNVEELQKALTASANKDSEKNGKDASSKTTDKNKKSKKKEKKKKDKESIKSKKHESKARNNSSTSNDTGGNNIDCTNKEAESNKEKETTDNSQSVTKRVNDLVITVPQQPSRKIKLNRNKVTVSIPNVVKDANSETTPVCVYVNNSPENTVKSDVRVPNKPQVKEKTKKKQKKEKRKNVDKDGSDHDEITLQLSDSEKRDLLEDLDRKNYEHVCSSSSDSESSSETDSDTSNASNKESCCDKAVEPTIINNREIVDINDKDKTGDDFDVTNKSIIVIPENANSAKDGNTKKKVHSKLSNSDNRCPELESNNVINIEPTEERAKDITNIEIEQPKVIEGYISIKDQNTANDVVITNIEDIPILQDENNSQEQETVKSVLEVQNTIEVEEKITEADEVENNDVVIESTSITKQCEKELSEGELSERESSEIEAVDLQPEVVCISDEEANKSKNVKKKKKKEKKAKKEKKSKKSKSDFREAADQNVYIDNQNITDKSHNTDNESISFRDEDDDLYEILELSDDSSCYEVEGTVLSKEPTAEEIEALSAKIDEIERDEEIPHVFQEQITEHETSQMEKASTSDDNEQNLENISWKDRYLDSKKVKRVLTSSKIINALRKKNKDLKKKLEESKKIESENEPDKEEITENKELEEGSIEHYKTLHTSVKYVDPVPDPALQKEFQNDVVEEKEESTQKIILESEEKIAELRVTGEMKKDAKQLLKMYKKLLKYNDMTKQRDPNKKKKRKLKKKEEQT